jgi:hypothetical protein
MSTNPDEDLITEVEAELANQNVSNEFIQRQQVIGMNLLWVGVIKNSVAHQMWSNYENNAFA